MRPRALAATLLQRGWERASRLGTVHAGSRRARAFGRFGEGSFIAFPITVLYGERWIWIGEDTRIGPNLSLSVGMTPAQVPVSDPVVRIGDRCVIGRGSGIVAHLSVDIGDDVWTGHYVYITDQNHGYEDVTRPIGEQVQPERPVSIGAGSWLGHGVVVLPGARIGRHVVVAANSVVSGELPDNCVAAGNPARVIRRYVEGEGWVRDGGGC